MDRASVISTVKSKVQSRIIRYIFYKGHVASFSHNGIKYCLGKGPNKAITITCSDKSTVRKFTVDIHEIVFMAYGNKSLKPEAWLTGRVGN